MGKKRVLLVIEQCNPEWASVPLVGYQFFHEISKLAEVTLVTHERNKSAIEKVKSDRKVFYIQENNLLKKYYHFIESIAVGKKGVNWPLLNTLGYLIYADFNQKVYQYFGSQVMAGSFDVVHAITPMMPRYPVKILEACKDTPFVLGPVNGGVPFPKSFEDIARKEFAHFNFLRYLGRFIPGYVKTYKTAQKILVGSTYTLEMLQKTFNIEHEKIKLFYENGVAKKFFEQTIESNVDKQLNLLFVGRLVPYKGADMVIEAISRLSEVIQKNLCLKIVGDGPERLGLEQQAQRLKVDNIVKFAGWVDQEKTLDYYKKADIFCFPSIREFGGAVVMEAMACGLPCIVVNNGGIAEYVTEKTGFKMTPVSRQSLVEELTEKIKILAEDAELRKSMSAAAIARAQEFEWSNKAIEITKIYEELLDEKKCRHSEN